MNETIKQDYFKLIRDLNKSNITKNESTELKFIILDNAFYAVVSNERKALLCQENDNHWYPSNYSVYTDLEDHIAHFLNNNKNITNLNHEIKLSIFKLLD